MTIRKFLTSVADVYGYNASDEIVFTGKTLLDSSIEVSLGSAPVRGGRGNQLQYIYYHTGEMKFTLTDTQWNLFMLGATVGEDPITNNNVYVEENVEVTASNGSVTGTPLAFVSGGLLYGWATSPLGVTQNIQFSTKAFTVTGVETGGFWCVRYYANDAASTSITINANIIPKNVKLVMETQLNSADVTTNKIGTVQIIAPTVTLSGAFTLSMKSDGVANTPLTATALAYTDSGSSTPCALEPYYAKIVEIIDNANWWDNVIGLSIEGGDFQLASRTATKTLSVWAIPSRGAAFKPPVAGLDFTSSITAAATIGLHTGIIQGITGGVPVMTVKGTTGTVPTIEATATVTVP
jgi:hypothetical protein